MSIDAYAACPGGTGKKVKFCCADLVSELEKIGRMLDGDQRQACLDHVDRLMKKHTGRACLCTIKANLERALGRADDADRTIQGLLAAQPANPVALASAAALAISERGVADGMAALQRATEAANGEFTPTLLEAVISMFGALLSEGNRLAARRYLLFYVQLTKGEDGNALRALLQLDQSPISLLEKQTPAFLDCAEDAPYRDELAEAGLLANRLAYGAAAKRFAKLAEEHPDDTAIAWNLALARTYLADNVAAAAAWRKFAALAVSLDDAVEAEAQAQLLLPDETADPVDLVCLRLPILNMEDCQARLSSDRRFSSASSAAFRAVQDEPPPTSGFLVLDRPMPGSASGASFNDAPALLAQSWLFGKQTDREARLEILAVRGPSLDQAKAMLCEVAGDALGATGEEEVLTQLSALDNALEISRVLPRDTTPDQQYEVNKAGQRQSYLEVLPRTPLKLLDGRTPEQAAGDPTYQVRLLGLILTLEASADGASFDFDELRRKLGLPTPEPIVATLGQLASLAPCRYRRLDCPKLDDEVLLKAMTRCTSINAVQATRNIGLEIVSRESITEKSDIDVVYGMLAEIEEDGRLALEYISKARDAALRKGKSSATWDLEELQLLAQRGDTRFATVFEHITREHLQEPGVREALRQIMQSMGLIDEYGQPRRGAASRDMAEPAIVGAESAAEPGKLWTPDSERPKEKSGLWLPGQQ